MPIEQRPVWACGCPSQRSDTRTFIGYPQLPLDVRIVEQMLDIIVWRVIEWVVFLNPAMVVVECATYLSWNMAYLMTIALQEKHQEYDRTHYQAACTRKGLSQCERLRLVKVEAMTRS